MSPQTVRIARIAADVVLVVAVAIGTMKLYELGLRELAATGFWKSWIAGHSSAARLAPALAIALACGLVGGIVLGGFAGLRALFLGVWSGVLVVALDFGGMIVADGLKGILSGFALAPLCIALGMVLGAAAGGKLMAGPPG
jgi:hypothetical protein